MPGYAFPVSPAYAACGGAVVADGPFPFGDFLALAGASVLTVVSIGFGIYDAATATPKSSAKAEVREKDEEITVKQKKDPIHHIVAQNDHRAEESRNILRGVGIDPKTDSLNLVVLPQSYHTSLHTTAYHKYITERLRPVAGDRAGVESTLISLKEEILINTLAGIKWD